MDLLGLRAHQRKQHVEVVDHHVEHHADVDRAEGHRAHAIDLDEARTDRARRDELAHGDHHGVVAHDMADLEERAGPLRHVGDGTGLGDIGRERLLDEARDARLEERLHDRAVGDGGCRDGDGVDARRDEFLDRAERATAPLLDDLCGALDVAVHHADEVAPLGRRIETRMVAPHLSDADRGAAKRLRSSRCRCRHRRAPAPSRRAAACATAFLKI